MGQNEQRPIICAAKQNIDRTLRHVDLGDLFPLRVVYEDLSIRNGHIALAVDRQALAAALGEGPQIGEGAVGAPTRAL